MIVCMVGGANTLMTENYSKLWLLINSVSVFVYAEERVGMWFELECVCLFCVSGSFIVEKVAMLWRGILGLWGYKGLRGDEWEKVGSVK